MELRKLEIHKLPGIEPGFVLEPQGPGVHLVVGPNAIGKSSLVRALGHLLASSRSDPPALSLSAEFAQGDTHWRVDRQGSQIVWRRNGEISPRPGLPGADQIGLYRLSVEHLLDIDDANDKEMARLLRRELYGNLDLDDLRVEINSNLKKRGLGSKEARTLTSARKVVRGVDSEYAALRRREEELPGIDRKIEAARMAERRCALLKKAVKLTEAIDARVAQEEELKLFPADLDRLRGDEPDRIDRHEAAIQDLQGKLRDGRARLTAAEDDLDLTGLVGSSPVPEEMEVAEQRLQQLLKFAVEREAVRQTCAEAAAAEKDALEQFNVDSERPRLRADALRRCEEIAQPLVAVEHRRLRLEEELSLAGDPPEKPRVERQRSGVEALRAWLAANAADWPERPGSSTGAIRLVLGGVLGVAALSAGAALLQGAIMASAGGMVAVLLSGVALWMQRDRGTRGPTPRAKAERRYGETGLPLPSQWEEHAVRRHLREVVEAGLNELILKEGRSANSVQITLQIQRAEAEIEELEKSKAALASEVGFDPAQPVVALDRFVRLCTEWDKVRRRQAEQTARLHDLEEKISKKAALVREFVVCWRAADSAVFDGVPGQLEFDWLRAAVDGLQRRCENAGTARSEIRNCSDSIQTLEKQIKDLEEARRSVFQNVGVASGDRVALDRRMELLPRWSAAKAAVDKASTEEELLRRHLVEAPDILELVEQGQRAQLKAELEAASLAADGHTSLIQKQTQIKTKLEDAGRDRKLEKAVAAESRARLALDERRDESLLATAMETLLDEVDEEFKADQEPAVLRRAREIFGEVTAHAFDLRLGEDGAFIAHDRKQETPRVLSELSSGTRMQLLLALRLAWTEAQERGGEALPLFLDEAMTTSDEGRFATMAESLERIAGSKDSQRQVFYLSARRHEPRLWLQVTGNEPTVIDLSAVRFPAEALSPEEYQVAGLPSVPAPDGRGAEKYGSALGVPSINAYLPPENFHLFHLLRDDLDLLHTLMGSWRINTVGQLGALLESDAGMAAVGSECSRRLLMRRCRIARIWVDLWRKGRGRPVDRSVLEQSKAISKSYIDRAADLIEQLQGDGYVLIQKLREKALRGFRTNKIDQLQRWLLDSGFVDDRDRLSREDRLRDVLQEIGPQSGDEASGTREVVGWLETAVRPHD